MKTTHTLLAVISLVLAVAACAAEEVPLQNQPPVALLSCPDAAHPGQQVAVIGKKSTDVDGKIKGKQLVFSGGPTLKQLDGTFTPSLPGVLSVTLTITDDKGVSGVANCRIPVDGEPIQLGDPTEPTDPTEPAEGEGEPDPTEGEEEEPIIGNEGEDDEPSEGEGEEEPAPEGVAIVQAYNLWCWISPWENTYHDDEGEMLDEAEAVLGFADTWSCDHPDLLRSSTVALGVDFAHVVAPNGYLASLPGLAGAPSQNEEYIAIYTTMLTPPAGADSLTISVVGDDVTAVMKAGNCSEQGGDDTDWCPFAVADREWAVDWEDSGFHPDSNTMTVDADPIPLQIRVGNADGPMSWNVDFAFYRQGARMDETGTFAAP